MLTFLLILASSGLPAASVIFFIVGAAFFLFSLLYGAFRAPLAWDRGIGVGLMISGIGLHVLFGL